MKHIPFKAWKPYRNLVKMVLENEEMSLCKYLWWKTLVPRKSRIIFIDEYSLINEGMLGLIKTLIEIYSVIHRRRTILVFSGDINQIHPLYESDQSSRFDCLSTFNYKFHFVQQNRISDTQYNDLLNSILTSPHPDNVVRKAFGKANQLVEYDYPIDVFTEAPPIPPIQPDESAEPPAKKPKIEYGLAQKDAEFDNFAKWFIENDVASYSKIMFFSYTNVELQYNNLSLALSIFNRLRHFQGIQLPNGSTVEPRNYVQFQTLRYFVGASLRVGYPLRRDRENGRIPILALIRYFPYKLLTRRIAGFPRSSILYLIDWCKEKCLMFSLEKKEFIMLPAMVFEMNLINGPIVGFPIQLYMSETSFSAQGLTLDREIYANLSRASREECYVMLSRVRTRASCKEIHVP